MKKLVYDVLFAGLIFCAVDGFPQGKQGTYNVKPTPQPIAVDGNLKDWGDLLKPDETVQNVAYAITDDKENIYFAVRIDDRARQEQAMRNGITLSFFPEGKRKETYTLTFPSPNEEDNGLYINPKADEAITEKQLKQEDAEERRKTDMLKLRNIDLSGFKDVETEHISTANTYGIKTVLNLDDAGALVYEAAVPISMLHTADLKNKPWVFDIKINTMAAGKPGAANRPTNDNASMGRGGMRGGGMGGGGMRGGGRMGGMNGGMGGYNNGGSQGKATEIKGKVML